MKKHKKSLLICAAALALGGLSGCDFFTKPLDFNENTTPQNQEEQKEQEQPKDESVHVDSLSLSATKLELLVGANATLVATVSPENATDKSVTFTSLDESIATVTSEGLVTGVLAGTTNIICQSNENGAKFQICSVTVKDAHVPVESVVIGQSSISVSKGSVTKLSASVSPVDATNQSLTWRSTNTDILTVDEEGNVTAVDLGAASIIVKSVDNPNADAIFNIKVLAVIVPVDGVAITQTSISLEENAEPVQLTCVVSPVDNENPENEASNKNVNWVSMDTGVAVVDQNGMVTPRSKGVTTIKAISAENSEYFGQCTVTVTRNDVVDLTLNKTSLAFSVGAQNNSFTLEATLVCQDTEKEATYKDILWSSSKNSVATVNNEGLVQSVGEGEAIIIATHVQSGISASCFVTVFDTTQLLISDVLPAKFYQNFEANRETNPSNYYGYFYDREETFEVGDDNPVNFLPSFSFYNGALDEIFDGDLWPYGFEIKVERLDDETIDTSAEYSIKDANNCVIDFTEAAVGKKYNVIVTAGGFPDEEDKSDLTATYVVKVVDGYNVTKAYELSYLDSYQANNGKRTEDRIAPSGGHDGVDRAYTIDYPTFKAEHGLENYVPKTIVLLNNISVGVLDLPSVYFYNVDDAEYAHWPTEEKIKSIGSLKDYAYLYVKDENSEMELSGNYFTIDFSRIPLVKRTNGRTMTGEEIIKIESHAKFSQVRDGSLEVRNLNIIGNAGVAKKEEEIYFAGGLGGFDIRNKGDKLVGRNLLAHNCYSTFFNDTAASGTLTDDCTLELYNCKFTDNYNTFIYNFGGDVMCDHCDFYGCGGPIIMQDHRSLSDVYDVTDTTEGTFELINWAPYVEFNDCTFDNYVIGEEAWFKSFLEVPSLVAQIKQQSLLLSGATPDNKLTFLYNSSKEPTTTFSGSLMNFIVLNKGVGEHPTAVQADGKVVFKVNGQEVDMYDYMNPVSVEDKTDDDQMATFTAQVAAYQKFRGLLTGAFSGGQPLPVFETSGGFATYMGGASIVRFDTLGPVYVEDDEGTEEDESYRSEFFNDAGQVAVYYNGMMLVFGSSHIGA